MRGRVDGALQLADQFRNRPVQVARDAPDRPAVARFPRMNPNGLKQSGCRQVVGVGDKRERHPVLDGLIFRVDQPRFAASPGGEDKSSSDRQHEGQPDSQCAPP